jgi:hypothetical protein
MTSSVSLTAWVSATLPKIGHRAEENEDAAAVAPDGLRFALADGATEGWESGPWAAHLTAAFSNSPPTPADFRTWLDGARNTWVPRATPGPVPWYAAAKQEEGSFATMVGVEFHHSPQRPSWGWKVVAVGDSCLLHVGGGELREAFPLTSPAAFGKSPDLVPSSPGTPCPKPEWLAGRADPGDMFLLATDAVAAQLLHPTALSAALSAVDESLRTRDSGPVLTWLRTVQAAANDDVSLIGIRLSAPEVT